MPSVGFVTNGTTEESKDDVAPPSVLMEHPPIAVFVNGKYRHLLTTSHVLQILVSMNEVTVLHA